MCFFSANLLLQPLSHLVQVPNSKSDSNCRQGVVDITIAVKDEKGNSIAGKEVVDITIAVEDEKGNSIAVVLDQKQLCYGCF